MTQLPIVDPFPLLAPIWLLKVLHNLTLALHLASVDLLLRGLVLAIAFRLMGCARPAGGLIAFFNVAALVTVRDGIRDVTLRAAGFDVGIGSW
jgi:hypothetical protein